VNEDVGDRRIRDRTDTSAERGGVNGSGEPNSKGDERSGFEL
jgi:hypothetical protein